MSSMEEIERKIDVEMSRDTLFEIYRERPNDISKMCPVIQGVDLISGEWGTVGSVSVWRYTDYDGNQKAKTVKAVIEAIDMKKKLVVFKVIAGDLLETFKSFKYSFLGETDENTCVMWTLEYEKLTVDVEDPEWMMDICAQVIKGIEAYHLQRQ